MTQEAYAPAYYTGNGSASVFSFGFYVSNQNNVRVFTTDTDGVQTELDLMDDFTVSFLEGNEGVGEVTLVAGALASGYRIAIHNEETITQETSIKNQQDYYPVDIEKAFDKATRISQQIQVQVDKSIALPEGISTDDFDPSLPSDIADNAGAAIIVNANGDGFTLGIPSGASLNAVSDTSTIDLTLASNTLSADVKAGSLDNTHVSGSAGIDLSKLETLSNYRLVASGGAGVIDEAGAITANRLLVSDSNGIPTHSAVSDTEAGYLDGVSSSIQDQLDDKVNLAGDSMGGILTLFSDPVSSLDAATKQYVDSQAAGNLHESTAVRVATTTNGTLASAFDNGSSVDGVTLATGDRILVKNQTTATENGIYIVEASGAPTRATDADSWDDELVGIVVSVTAGSTNAATSWSNNNVAGGTFGVTDVTFVYHPFGQVGTAGNGLQKSGVSFSIKHDGASLSSSSSGLKIPNDSISNALINAAAGIEFSKMEALTANKVAQIGSTGEVEASSVSTTTLGYLDASSSIQTQLDAKIAKSLVTTTGDIIYASGANTPARLGVGTNGQVLTLAGGVPSWADSQAAGQNISYSVFLGSSTAGSTSLTVGSWSTIPLLGSADISSGTAWSRSGDNLTPAFTGKYTAIYIIENISCSGNAQAIMFRARNTSSGTTPAVFNPRIDDPDGYIIAVGRFSVTSISHVHQFQYYYSASGGGAAASISNAALGGETPPRWALIIMREGA